MRKKYLNLLAVSVILTLIAFLMDGDVKEPSMVMRFVEFFAMSAIVFILISSTVLLTHFAIKKFHRI